jgi:hypothetical protein
MYLYILHCIISDSDKIANSNYYDDAKVFIVLFPFYTIAFCSSFLYREAAIIFTMSTIEYRAPFKTCSEIEDTGLKLAAWTVLDDVLRVAQEEAVGSLENTTLI